MLFLLLSQQQIDPFSSTLPQYGAIGLLALAGLLGIWILWKRIDRVYEAEHQRADRLEQELLNLNRLISTELSGHLVRATEAMKEVTEMLRHNRDRDRGER